MGADGLLLANDGAAGGDDSGTGHEGECDAGFDLHLSQRCTWSNSGPH
jgi:hypothetical protein